MYSVELYARVRPACHVEGLSIREAARMFGLHRDTVRKMLRFSIPPGYQRSRSRVRPKLGPFTGVIDRILKGDYKRLKRQRHTAKRIFERLRDEHGFTGSYTIVKDDVRERRLRSQEMFVPLVHPLGHAQADFGEALAEIAGNDSPELTLKEKNHGPKRSSSRPNPSHRGAVDGRQLLIWQEKPASANEVWRTFRVFLNLLRSGSPQPG